MTVPGDATTGESRNRLTAAWENAARDGAYVLTARGTNGGTVVHLSYRASESSFVTRTVCGQKAERIWPATATYFPALCKQCGEQRDDGGARTRELQMPGEWRRVDSKLGHLPLYIDDNGRVTADGCDCDFSRIGRRTTLVAFVAAVTEHAEKGCQL